MPEKHLPFVMNCRIKQLIVCWFQFPYFWAFFSTTLFPGVTAALTRELVSVLSSEQICYNTN